MASETTPNDLKVIQPAYDRLYDITKKLHDDFAAGQTTIERHTFEEMLAASQGMLLELKALLAAAPAEVDPAPAAPAPKPAARKTATKKTTCRKTAVAKADREATDAEPTAPRPKPRIRKTATKKTAAKPE